jgi:hypothetical protein
MRRIIRAPGLAPEPVLIYRQTRETHLEHEGEGRRSKSRSRKMRRRRLDTGSRQYAPNQGRSGLSCWRCPMHRASEASATSPRSKTSSYQCQLSETQAIFFYLNTTHSGQAFVSAKTLTRKRSSGSLHCHKGTWCFLLVGRGTAPSAECCDDAQGA